MTAFNREKYIGEAIESVLASTLQDFELIIVDDCSVDGTLSIANAYQRKDERIRVYQNEVNLGDYPNRNRAASYAKGKYLKYLDSDDSISPHGLVVFVNSMEAFPDAAVGVTTFKGRDEQKYPFRLSPVEAYHYNFYTNSLFDIGPSGLIFNAEKFRNIGGFSGKRYVGDIEINLRLAARWSVVKIEGGLISWRQHEGQEINAGLVTYGYLEMQLPMYREAFRQSYCPLPKDQQKAVLKYHRKIAAREIMKIVLLKKRLSLAIKYYRQLALSPMDFFNAAFLMKYRY